PGEAGPRRARPPAPATFAEAAWGRAVREALAPRSTAPRVAAAGARRRLPAPTPAGPAAPSPSAARPAATTPPGRRRAAPPPPAARRWRAAAASPRTCRPRRGWRRPAGGTARRPG